MRKSNSKKNRCRHTSPAVSVIIPTYNRAAVLGRALDSVITQTFNDLEIIVVDDGSTDHTRKLVERISVCSDIPIHYLYQRHGNAASARNRGLRLACGALIAFLDSDDAWHPDKLWQQVLKLESSTAALVHTGRTLRIMPGNRRHRVRPHTGEPARNRTTLLSGKANVAMTVLVRRSALDRVGHFDTGLKTSEDLDLWLRLAKHYELEFIDRSLMTSYKQADSSMSADPERTCRDRISVCDKMLRQELPQDMRRNWETLRRQHLHELNLHTTPLPVSSGIVARRITQHGTGGFNTHPRPGMQTLAMDDLELNALGGNA